MSIDIAGVYQVRGNVDVDQMQLGAPGRVDADSCLEHTEQALIACEKHLRLILPCVTTSYIWLTHVSQVMTPLM